MNRPRILLVDDHTIVRTSLRLLLQSAARCNVVGESTTGAEACDLASKLMPQVTILDLDLAGDEDPIVNIKRIRAACEETRVLATTALRDDVLFERATVAGAVGIVLKDYAMDTLLSAIQTITTGSVWLDPYVAARVLARLRNDESRTGRNSARIASLTRREREVITAVCEGLRDAEIARHLLLSETRVRRHLLSITSKLAVTGRLELMVYAHRYGLAKARG